MKIKKYFTKSQTTSTYRCQFRLKGQVLSVVSEAGLVTFKDGFWLDGDYKLVKYPTGVEDASFVCRYWIPPGKIDFIAIDRIKI